MQIILMGSKWNCNDETLTVFVAVFQNQQQNSSKFPKKIFSCKISRFVLRLKLLEELSWFLSTYQNFLYLDEWNENKEYL